MTRTSNVSQLETIHVFHRRREFLLIKASNVSNICLLARLEILASNTGLSFFITHSFQQSNTQMRFDQRLPRCVFV